MSLPQPSPPSRGPIRGYCHTPVLYPDAKQAGQQPGKRLHRAWPLK